MKTDFVTVQYEDRFRPGTYGGREYSYIADHRLKVGDVVYVEDVYKRQARRGTPARYKFVAYV